MNPIPIHKPHFRAGALILAGMLAGSVNTTAMTPVGIFDHHQDVGDPALTGSAQYDPSAQTYQLSGAGKNMWFGEDQFHFAWKQLSGDFIIQATVRFVGDGVDPHRKIGLMARESLEAGSAYADACVHGDILTSLQYRSATGADTEEVRVSSYHPTEIQLERRGDTFIFSAGVFGEEYKSSSKELKLAETLHVGIFICSHREDVVESAVFSNVRITQPAPADLVPYRDFLGSHIEVMEVATGHRRILHSENRSLQAPNWTTDGEHLIYNAEGLLYRFSLKDRSNEILDTGMADRNNNDHVLSFDGAQLGISHHVGEESISTIYVLPATGSAKPRQVTRTENGHSYLHGWSPDAKSLVFTGSRNGQYDIWSVDIDSGAETQLTNLATLDDGAEYTPDGSWIYFNSVRTGNMQIWRMRPDGSGQEQVTFDTCNNWFPHVSPDGKWIVYLAYLEEIDPSSHPFYKRVALRLIPASGGVPRTIAHLYGGQGSINVPSWSPCSRYIAFVSNTAMQD